MNLSRRRLIFTGVAGAAVIVAARWLRPSREDGAPALSADGANVMRAIVPAMLDGALPEPAAERKAAIEATVGAIGAAIAGLPPAARDELSTLFGLLALAPVRVAFADIDSGWRDADVTATNAFLIRLQKSRWSVKRAAYDALHQLTFAAWYANPLAWPSIGYPGPPLLR